MNTFVSGKASETYSRCLEAVQSISRATLFAPVTRVDVVRAMSKLSFISSSLAFISVLPSPRRRLV